MEVDRDYATDKLELLLRDIGMYTAEEFWRQMSRIAAGATGMPHAEELRQDCDMHRDAEMAWEKAMMQAIGEDGIRSAVEAIEQLRNEREALAAHVEACQPVVRAYADACFFDVGKEGLKEDAKRLARHQPEASLARLIAEKQAEALNHVIDNMPRRVPVEAQLDWLVGEKWKLDKKASQAEGEQNG
ncbi:hypothetical protein GCM10027040_27200 [Halomonas shantousis]